MNQFERKKRQQLDKLFSDLRIQVATKEDILFSDGNYYNPAEYLCEDGFYPGYFNAKYKVLFIAREARYASGCNRIDSDLLWLKKYEIGSCNFWRRLFYICYGIKTEGNLSFNEIPYADSIKNEMIKSEDFGFAFMNISKYSNDNDNWIADRQLIHRFFKDSEIEKRNYLKEELEILAPDIIITGNIWDPKLKIDKYLDLVFPPQNFTFSKEKSSGKYSSVWEYSESGKSKILIDLYHFSALKVKDEISNKWLAGEILDKVGFYDPVIKAIFKR